MAAVEFAGGEVERLLRHLKSGHMTDFTIRLREKKWKIHGIILSRVSDFFSKACVSEFQEAATRVIDLHDDSTCMLARLILFCYVGAYPSPESAKILQPKLEELAEDGKDGELTVHATMYGMGDKYCIPALEKLSKDNYVHTLKKTKYSVTDFIQSIPVAFKTSAETDEELRKWAVWEAQNHSALLSSYPDFKDIMTKTPDFAYDLATKYARGSFTWCETCKKRDVIELRNRCMCGFSSMCGLSEYCQDPQSLIHSFYCSFCGSRSDIRMVDRESLQNAKAETLKAFWTG